MRHILDKKTIRSKVVKSKLTTIPKSFKNTRKERSTFNRGPSGRINGNRLPHIEIIRSCFKKYHLKENLPNRKVAF